MNIKLTDAVLARLDPVGTMLHLMRTALRAGEVNLALDCARSAAPYVSPKLQASTVLTMNRRSIDEFTNDDLDAMIAGNTSDLSDEELQVLITGGKTVDQKTREGLRKSLETPRPVVVEDGEK